MRAVKTVGWVFGALVAATLALGACGWLLGSIDYSGFEGDTFQIDLVNDTPATLVYLGCDNEDACESFFETFRVDPGESGRVGGDVGVVTWWQVNDLEGRELGCFKIDFDYRPKVDLYASRLAACP